jgi:uncharacterized membrane protein
MARSKQEWGDTQIEVIIGNLLRVGVTLSAVLVFVGGVLYLYKYGAVRPHYRIFRGEPEVIRSIPAVVRFALAEHSRGIIQAGLLLLIATPVARVVFSVYAFARERDWLYVGVTLLVLAILLYSLVWGKV